MIAVASWSLVGVAAFASTASAPKRVGVVIANGFEMLDAIGPFEVFKEIENTYFAHVNLASQTWSDTALQPGIQCSADGGPPLHVEVELVADSLTPVTSLSGVTITPTYDLKEDPEAKRYDLLVFGALSSSKYEGARTEYKDGHTQTTKDYLKAHNRQGKDVMTVCIGVQVVAELGLLDGKNATTNSLFLDDFRNGFPNVRWLSADASSKNRVVQSTEAITTCAGVSSGIDGALAQAKKWCGRDAAEALKQCLEWPVPVRSL